jgi:hypothetical protein
MRTKVPGQNQKNNKPLKRSSGMKKIILALVVACLANGSMAQEYTPTPEQVELNNMMSWLFEYYNYDKDAAYQTINGIQSKVVAEFPMDPKLAEAVKAAEAKGQAAQLALAQKYGFATIDAFYGEQKYHPEKYPDAKGELQAIYVEQSTQISILTKAYTDELNRRIQTAEIEAIQRLQANANTMKK